MAIKDEARSIDPRRLSAAELQNVLDSTDVATLFLDPDLGIRFFTPATKALFGILPGDVGRKLADLTALAPDAALLADARRVLRHGVPIEREIEAPGGAWYIRRILPYQTPEGGIDGVVITFANITDRKHAADMMDEAKRQAELANLAKSRFLAAASHDLRQPLQTLALLQGLLANAVEGDKAKQLVGRLDETLVAMSGMLNTLLDMNQIEAGTVEVELADLPVDRLFDQLRDEFTYHAQAQRLGFRVVPCRLSIRTDPRLLEQMLRNLLSNALKYTKSGRVLLGCRRRAGALVIEVWDTGLGIPAAEHQSIFEEYHQLDNAARNRSRGLGLGLAIVRRLGKLLGHPVGVRSIPGKGSVFSIEVPCLAGPAVVAEALAPATSVPRPRAGTILVVEDDPELRELLEMLLKEAGYRVAMAADGAAALDWVAQAAAGPDLILTDFNLPNGLNGLQLTEKLRRALRRPVPVIILTGDISTTTLREVALQNFGLLNKPVKAPALKEAIARLLATAAPAPPAVEDATAPVVFVVDDNDHVRHGLRSVLEEAGRRVEAFADGEAFLAAYRPGREGCLLVDAGLPGMSGLDLLQHLQKSGDDLPAIMITGHSDVAMAVDAMKAGALDFIEKPVSRSALLASVALALDLSRDAAKLSAHREDAADHVAGLTLRQRQIMELVLAGHPSKNIAADLGISQRTVENHRAAIMKKTGSKSLPALARLALAASELD